MAEPFKCLTLEELGEKLTNNMLNSFRGKETEELQVFYDLLKYEHDNGDRSYMGNLGMYIAGRILVERGVLKIENENEGE